MKRRSIIFGCGSYFRRYISKIHNMDIIAVVDNDREKQGKTVEQYTIDSPSIILELQFDRVYIVCLSVNPIREQLLEMGIPENKIFYYFDLLDGDCYFVHRKNNLNGQGTKISIVSHDFSITGAQNSLRLLVGYLVKRGYNVKVASPSDGEMSDVFFDMGADTLVDERLRSGTLKRIEWLKDSQYVWVNTVQMYYLLREDISIPIFWWLHEPPCFYTTVVKEIMDDISFKHIRVLSVSNVADDAFHQFSDQYTKRLLYGIEDYQVNPVEKEKEVFQIIVIGAISKLKGHDILVKAIRMLPTKERNMCHFVLVGGNTTTFARDILDRLDEMGVSYSAPGMLPNSETLVHIAESDVLLCASQVESMSATVTEAMMLSIPCIVTSNAGIVEYIENEVNAYIYMQDSPQELASRISFCIHHRKGINKVGHNGRKVYEMLFTKKCFEDCIDQLLL